jgi:hypothetical protein
MATAAPANPNICVGCAQLLDDESPVQAVQAGDEGIIFTEGLLVKAGGDRETDADPGWPRSNVA